MIVQYNKIAPDHRSLVRSIEAKSYVNYIRYLLLKRWSFIRIQKELTRLGLPWDDQKTYEVYFAEVLYPVIKKRKLTKYFKSYYLKMEEETLRFSATFKSNEKDRIEFVDMVRYLGIEQFFAEEIVSHYGGVTNIPSHPTTGEPIISKEKPVDLVELLQNPKRHVIEKSLVDGYSPEQISDHLYQMYDMELSAQEIKVYAKSFFNVTRQDIHRLIENLQAEKDQAEKRLAELRRLPSDEFSFGERFEVLSTARARITELDSMIRRLSGVHTNTTYNAAVLEVSDIREMFKDITMRAHRRWRDMDERTEDEVVGPLNSITNMMAKATEKIMAIDEVLSIKTSKSVNEQLIEAVMPTLERIEEEEKEAFYAYKQMLNGSDDEDDDDGILGFDN